MKKQILLFILIISVQISFCQTDFAYHLPDSVTEKELISKIIENGDSIAYLNLYYYYSNHKEIGQTLPYSLIMANKWEYSKAMYHVYTELLFLYDCLFWHNIEIMDKISRRMALEYLIRYYKNSPACRQKESAYKYHILKYVEKGYLKIIDGNIILSEKE